MEKKNFNLEEVVKNIYDKMIEEFGYDESAYDRGIVRSCWYVEKDYGYISYMVIDWYYDDTHINDLIEELGYGDIVYAEDDSRVCEEYDYDDEGYVNCRSVYIKKK